MISGAGAIASAAIGAASALAVIVTENHLKEKADKANVDNAYTRGYYEGRESVLRDSFANAQPQDFTKTR